MHIDSFSLLATALCFSALGSTACIVDSEEFTELGEIANASYGTNNFVYTNVGQPGQCMEANSATGNVELGACTANIDEQWSWASGYTVTSMVAPNACLQIDGVGSSNVAVSDCNGSSLQQWVQQSEGKLESLDQPGQCLTGFSGGNVGLAACATVAAQLWGEKYYAELRSAVSPSRCWNAFTSSSGNTTNLRLDTCDQSSEQLFEFQPIDNTIRSVDGQCVAADTGGNGANGTNITLASCTGTPNQQWLRNAGYGLENAAYSGQCIEATTTVAIVDNLELWPCDFAMEQIYY